MIALNKKLQIYLFCILTFWLSACSITRHLEDDQIILTRVEFNGVEDAELIAGLKENLRYKPNRKILGIYPFYLQAWNFGYDGRDSTKIRTFFREKVGEAPVLLDSAAIVKGIDQLKLYLFNNGYFNAEVEYSVRVHKKRAHLSYNVILGEYYSIANISYHIYDKAIYKLVTADSLAYIKEGKRFNTENLSEERNRLEDKLRNSGYYFFNREYIAFDVDTSNGNRTLDLAIVISNPSVQKRHQVYKIDEVILDVDYLYFLSGKDDSTFHDVNGIKIRTNGFPMHYEALARFVKIKSGTLYREDDFRSTYNAFLDLQIVKSLNFNVVVDTSNRLLNVIMTLDPMEELEFRIEPQAITSDQSSAVQASNRRIWGLSSQVALINKNAFKGAEIFDIRLGNSAEFQYLDKRFNFSNFEQTVSASITIPKLWIIEDWNLITKHKPVTGWRKPSTTYNLSFSYEYNQDFIQRTILLTWAYTFGNQYNFFRWVPAEINLNQVNIRSDLLQRLGPGDRVLLASILNPNFIPSQRFEWNYNDNGLSASGSYHAFRWNMLELSGNLWSLGYLAAGEAKPYKVLNTNLFQYVKTEFDMRYYDRPQRDVSMAYRARMGISVPIWNSRVIPFDKRYFIGGANSLRGWRPRTVGPGNYNETSATQIDRSGELVMEGSAELRFTVIDGLLLGAVFLDGGNIWNIHADSSLKGAEFKLNKFYNQFALNSGIGVRFDFSFFLVRLDMGTQFRDPSFTKYNGWVFKDYNYLGRRIAFNFGVGYPF